MQIFLKSVQLTKPVFFLPPNTLFLKTFLLDDITDDIREATQDMTKEISASFFFAFHWDTAVEVNALWCSGFVFRSLIKCYKPLLLPSVSARVK